jgi:hypothetical protein
MTKKSTTVKAARSKAKQTIKAVKDEFGFVQIQRTAEGSTGSWPASPGFDHKTALALAVENEAALSLSKCWILEDRYGQLCVTSFITARHYPKLDPYLETKLFFNREDAENELKKLQGTPSSQGSARRARSN